MWCTCTQLLWKLWKTLTIFWQKFHESNTTYAKELNSIEITYFTKYLRKYQKFRENNGFTKEITKQLIWWNIYLVRVNFPLYIQCLTSSHANFAWNFQIHFFLELVNWFEQEQCLMKAKNVYFLVKVFNVLNSIQAEKTKAKKISY